MVKILRTGDPGFIEPLAGDATDASSHVAIVENVLAQALLPGPAGARLYRTAVALDSLLDTDVCELVVLAPTRLVREEGVVRTTTRLTRDDERCTRGPVRRVLHLASPGMFATAQGRRRQKPVNRSMTRSLRADGAAVSPHRPRSHLATVVESSPSKETPV